MIISAVGTRVFFLSSSWAIQPRLPQTTKSSNTFAGLAASCLQAPFRTKTFTVDHGLRSRGGRRRPAPVSQGLLDVRLLPAPTTPRRVTKRHCFRNWYNCQFICDSCPACVHIRQLNHANYRRDARWRPHQITHQQYIENTPPESLSPWLGMPGFVLSRALWDLMHTIHLGIAKDLCAQVMADLCRQGYEGDGPLAQQLRRLWIRFRLYCSRHSIPYSRRKFSPKIIGISDTGGLEFPELNSRTKAAHVKPIISFLAYRCKKILAPKFKKAGDRNSELRAWACFGLADFLHTLDNAGTLLTEAEVAKARISGRIYLLSWQSLAHAACAQGLCAYKCRPKGHYFDHLLQQLDTLENPKGLSNFLSEDFIGKVVRLAKQQHRISCVRRTVELYSMALRHRWRHVKTFFAGWSCNLANCVGFMCPLPSLGPLSSKPSHQI